MLELKILKKQNNAGMCFVCGVDNYSSLQTEYYEVETDKMVGILTGREIHQSYPKRMHGGVITALLDETIGRAIQIYEPDTWAVTIELTTNYIHPVPLDEAVYVVGMITRNRRLIFEGTGYICDQRGKILARASGKYIKRTIEEISDHPLSNEEWKYVAPKQKIEFVVIPE